MLILNMAINLISPEFRKRFKKAYKQQKLFLLLTKISISLGLLFLFLSFAPSIWYSLGSKVDEYSAALLETVSGKESEVKPENKDSDLNWQPPFYSNLTRDTSLTIPSIGVSTVVNESTYETYENALRKGVWRIPDFGTPFERSKPTILAAHRFGYLAWTNKFRRENSFFNLPKLKVGELVQITHKQRKYVYEVYAESRGEEISDYSANLILYTCETLNSKVRIFKYARLLHI